MLVRRLLQSYALKKWPRREIGRETTSSGNRGERAPGSGYRTIPLGQKLR